MPYDFEEVIDEDDVFKKATKRLEMITLQVKELEEERKHLYIFMRKYDELKRPCASEGSIEKLGIAQAQGLYPSQGEGNG